MTTFTSEDLIAVLKEKTGAVEIRQEPDGSFTYTCIEPVPFVGMVTYETNDKESK
jgi:hypothetical protein